MKALVLFFFAASASAVPWTFFHATMRNLKSQNEVPFHPDPKIVLPEYDFVIVGAGPAGCVLANRLSEIPEWNVLLIEAGRYETVLSEIPVFVSYFQFTDFNWHYFMERQEGVCEAMVDGLCHWPRGKGVGGTSIINYMIYTRGNRQDFLDLEAAGNYGWGPNETWSYYMKSEDAKLKDHPGSPYHNRGGYLDVQDVPYRTPMSPVFLEAAKELGYKVLDYNGEEQFGFSYIQATMRNGRRCSAAKAFLKPVLDRPNLHVLTKTRATKILIDPITKATFGVEYVRNRQRGKVIAKKEVILTSGALSSPHLLMLSGVGPAEHLRDFGIPVIRDLRVGKNLQDHISLLGLTFLTNQTEEVFTETRLTNPKHFLEWIRGRGPATLPGTVEAIGYVRTKYNKLPGTQPDIELIFTPASLNSDEGSVYRGINIDKKNYNAVYKSIYNKPCFSIAPMLLHPKSSGELLLKSSDPFAWPKFYGNYLTHDIDVKTMVEGIKEAVRISQTDAFKRFATRLHETPFPKCRHEVFGSDRYWECTVRMVTATLHHQVGTCKMGPKSDPEAVVDPELRVHGIDFLRVADTSIIPKSWSAHTNAPSFMIGEKAADMIKKTWGRI